MANVQQVPSEMTAIYRIKKKCTEGGQWVRMKRGFMRRYWYGDDDPDPQDV